MDSLLVAKIIQRAKQSNAKFSKDFSAQDVSQIFLQEKVDLAKFFMDVQGIPNVTLSLGISLDRLHAPNVLMLTWEKRLESPAAKIPLPSCFVLSASTKNPCRLKLIKKPVLVESYLPKDFDQHDGVPQVPCLRFLEEGFLAR